MPSLTVVFVLSIIAVALAFDFTNGMHDAANSIATVVSTRVLNPRQAVAWAAFFNFVAFLIFGTGVATTIGTGLIDIRVVTPLVILAGLLGAIGWNLFTWYMGLPTSSSHALIGGYAGAAIIKAGAGVIIPGGWVKTILFIFLAPVLGMILGVVFITLTTRLIYKQHPAKINRWSRRIQLFSAALYSLGHGGNDAQKTMGIIAGLVFSVGWFKTFHIALWIVLSAHAAIAMGTLTGGWRIVKTMGQKITKLKPVGGFCAETGGAMTLFLATGLGIPVSTTHTITGAIIGVGATRKFSAVRWGVAERIVWAWVLTIPCVAFMSALAWWFAHRLL
jgi:PiT family inorganic phosphate transporter